MHRPVSLVSAVLVMAAMAAPVPSLAQTWTPVAEAPGNMTAAVARWPSGVALAARCQEGRDMALILTLAQPVAQPTVDTVATWRDGATGERVNRLSENGRLLFMRQPVGFARSLIQREGVVIEVAPRDAPAQRYELEAPDGVEALADVLAACGHDAQSPIAPGSVVTNPDWLRRPSGADMAGAYPSNAARLGVGGDVVIECLVARDGQVEDCVVVSETPEGMGFGAAAVAVSGAFRMRPQQVDGQPQGEIVIRIPISWRIG